MPPVAPGRIVGGDVRRVDGRMPVYQVQTMEQVLDNADTTARIMTTLIHGLQAADKQFGIETMCVGGGQGMAMVIERLS